MSSNDSITVLAKVEEKTESIDSFRFAKDSQYPSMPWLTKRSKFAIVVLPTTW